MLFCDSRLWHCVPDNKGHTPRVAIAVRYAPWWFDTSVVMPGSAATALSRAVSFVCRPVRRSPQLTLPGDSMLLSISLDEWIRWYTQEPNAALVAYANFLVYAAGLRKVHLDLATVVDSLAPPEPERRRRRLARRRRTTRRGWNR